MEFSVLLIKVLGIYSLIMAFLMLVRRRAMIDFMKGLKKNHALVRLTGSMELLIGLFMVLGLAAWSGSGLLITVIGIAAIAEGAFYLFSDSQTVDGLVKTFTRPGWYYTATLIALIFGAYLTAVGFGLW